MSNEIDADYDQVFLFPPTLEEFIPLNHPARFIREFVGSLDLASLGFSVRESNVGAPNYSSALLLRAWLYGYYNKVYSTRGLEKLCYNDLGMLWLTGMSYPDHNTLWRFFRTNQCALKRLFVESVRLATELGLVGLVLHALDGTKVEADASNSNALHRDYLERLLKELDKEIDDYFSKVEEQEVLESGLEYILPDELSDKLTLRQKIRSGLRKLEESSTSHLSNVDDDARMMKIDERFKFAYNAQTVADAEKGVIVGSEVINKGTDNHQLTEMLGQVQENLGEVAEETLADAGYYSGSELAKAQEKGYDVLVNLPKEKDQDSDFHKSKFNYDEKTNTYICPKGGTLTFESNHSSGRGDNYTNQVYRCRDYKDCAHRFACSRDPRGRSVKRSEYDWAVNLQKEKQRKEDKKNLLLQRRTIVEPVIGIIKNVLGFRRFSYRGLAGVRSQWYLICTVINLRKIVKYT